MRSLSAARLSSIAFLLVLAQTTSLHGQRPTIQTQGSSAASSGPLAPFVSQFTRHAGKVGCQHSSCKILVMDFVLPNSHTSGLGIQLADMLSSQLAKGEGAYGAVDRSLLRNLLQRDRIPSRVQNQSGVARWLAKKLNADVFVLGETTKKGEDKIELSTHFLSVIDEKRKPLNVKADFSVGFLHADISPTDALETLPPFGETLRGERVYRAGVQGVGMPRCFNMPSPPYTQDARDAHFSGIVQVEALISLDGRVEPLRVVTGAPGGLNEMTLKTMTTWRCQPAQLNGKAVPTLVPFEITFQLY